MSTASLRALSIAHPELKAAEVILIPDEFIEQQLIEQEKKLHLGVQELLVKCITEGSPPQLKDLFGCVLCDSTPHSDCLSIHWSVGWLVCWLVPLWAAALKGPMTYAFTYAEISPPPPSPPSPLPQPPGPYLSLEAHIPALRPKSQS